MRQNSLLFVLVTLLTSLNDLSSHEPKSKSSSSSSHKQIQLLRPNLQLYTNNQTSSSSSTSRVPRSLDLHQSINHTRLPSLSTPPPSRCVPQSSSSPSAVQSQLSSQTTQPFGRLMSRPSLTAALTHLALARPPLSASRSPLCLLSPTPLC